MDNPSEIYSLCDTCMVSHIIVQITEPFREKITTTICRTVSPNIVIEFPVESCNNYIPPGQYDYEEDEEE